MIALQIETAKRERLSRHTWGKRPKLIKAGEKCLVIKDFQGWKTNIEKNEAAKILKDCLLQLKQSEKKGEKMISFKQVKNQIAKNPVQNSFSLVGITFCTYHAAKFLLQKFKERNEENGKKEKDILNDTTEAI